MTEIDASEVDATRSSSSGYAGRVPTPLKLNYAIGASAEAIVSIAFNSFNFFFYTNLLGVPGTLAGLAITIALFFDAITDPLIGAWSDRWRSKLGRRHPFMFAAPLPVMAALFFIYSPPAALGEFGLFIWLTVLTVLMRGCMTLFHVPHLALGAELSADFTERTRVMAINTLLGTMAGIATIFIAYSVFFATTPEFANGMFNRDAYPALAMGAALVGGAIMLYSSLSTMSVIPRLSVNAVEVQGFSFSNFLSDCLEVIKNRNYRVLLIGYLLLSATLGVRDTIGLHMNTYFWELLPSQIRFLALGLVIAPLVGFLVTAPLHERFDKKPVIIVCLIALLIFVTAPVLLRIMGWFPENDSKWLFWALISFVVLWASAGAVLLISVMSALADISDEQALLTGRRQEGVFYAARSFFAKASSGLGHLVAGISIDIIDFPVGADPGTVDSTTLLHLGLIDGPIAVIPGAIAIFFYLKYGLTRARHTEIQQELQQVLQRALPPESGKDSKAAF